MEGLLLLKVRLYKSLLQEMVGKTEDEVLDSDVNIMYELSRDPSVMKLYNIKYTKLRMIKKVTWN